MQVTTAAGEIEIQKFTENIQKYIGKHQCENFIAHF